jgi:hypothetical protein
LNPEKRHEQASILLACHLCCYLGVRVQFASNTSWQEPVIAKRDASASLLQLSLKNAVLKHIRNEIGILLWTATSSVIAP